MEVLRYPMICWKIAGNKVYAALLGMDHEMLAVNVKKIKTAFQAQITREGEKWGFDEPPILQPKIKILQVKIRSAYKEKEGSYPVNNTIKIPILAVYGKTGYGVYQCFLPFLQANFFYYNTKQLNNLIEHFAQNEFKELPPEKTHRYIMPESPWLEEVVVRVKNKDVQKKRLLSENIDKLLAAAEKYPPSKGVRKKTGLFPEVAWEQTAIIHNIMEKISKEQSNLLIVGEHGVGKSAVLYEAVRKLHVTGKKDKSRRTYWKTTSHRLIAGARYLGEWQEMCEEVMEELQRVKGVLWITDFINLFHTGGEGGEDSVAAFISSHVETGKVQIIAEVTPRELEAARNILPGFCEFFQTIYIHEVEPKKLLKILQNYREYTRERWNIEFTISALEVGHRLLSRFIKYQKFPGKAMQFFSKCLNQAYIEKLAKIDKDHIIDNFIEHTGLAEIFLRDDLLLDMDELEQYFAKRIIGQPQAIKDVCQVVKIFKTGLNDPQKPISTMLFAGPTGVGKTATAKALADYFFGQGQKLHPLIRLDMSEFQIPGQISRLIGTGTKPGNLIKQIRERPFSVLLLDEIEKADSSIFDALLTMLDEGIMVDAYGRLTDFRNTIIIMTSNLGANVKALGFNDQGPDYRSSIKSHFRPEFYNRLDAITIFYPLERDIILQITKKELEDLQQREGIIAHNISLQFDNSLVDYLAEKGFDKAYGARPLQRAVEQWAVAPLAKFLLENKVQGGKISLKYDGKKVVVKKGK